MIISHKEMIETKKNLLRQMNDYIINLGNEEIWEEWITYGVPDCPSEDDFNFIASNDNDWNEVCNLFGILVNK